MVHSKRQASRGTCRRLLLSPGIQPAQRHVREGVGTPAHPSGLALAVLLLLLSQSCPPVLARVPGLGNEDGQGLWGSAPREAAILARKGPQAWMTWWHYKIQAQAKVKGDGVLRTRRPSLWPRAVAHGGRRDLQVLLLEKVQHRGRHSVPWRGRLGRHGRARSLRLWWSLSSTAAGLGHPDHESSDHLARPGEGHRNRGKAEHPQIPEILRQYCDWARARFLSWGTRQGSTAARSRQLAGEDLVGSPPLAWDQAATAAEASAARRGGFPKGEGEEAKREAEGNKRQEDSAHPQPKTRDEKGSVEPDTALGDSTDLRLRVPQSVEDVKRLQRLLASRVAEHPVQFVAGFSLLYLCLQTFSLPGSTVLNILAGSLCGFLPGLLLITFLVTLGTLGSYTLSALLLCELLQRWMPTRLERLRAEVAAERHRLLGYLLFLRFNPVMPSWFVNIASPVVGVPWQVFAAASVLGFLPHTILQVHAGCVLSTITSLNDLYSPKVIILLCLFSILALVPAILKANSAKPPRLNSASS